MNREVKPHVHEFAKLPPEVVNVGTSILFLNAVWRCRHCRHVVQSDEQPPPMWSSDPDRELTSK